MGVTERKEREKLEMKSLILETATRMFVEEGFEKTSIRNIAERIEYSPATIYLYYKDKNELFFDVHEKGFEKMFEWMKPLTEVQNPLERLHQMGDMYVKFAFENPEYYDLMFIMTAPLDSLQAKGEHWDCGFQNYEVLRQTVRQCIEQELMKPMDVDIATMSIFSFVHGMVSLAIRNRFVMYQAENLANMFRQSITGMIDLMKTERTA